MLDNNSTLLCANCGSINLHHIKVNIFNRTEDAEEGVQLEIATPRNKAAQINVSTDLTGNPSGRRDGLSVSFMCENCPEKTTLSIYQHKGSTYLERKVTK